MNESDERRRVTVTALQAAVEDLRALNRPANDGPLWQWASASGGRALLFRRDGKILIRGEEMPERSVARLTAAAPDMKRILEHVEWRGHANRCPVCEQSQTDRHAIACELGRILGV